MVLNRFLPVAFTALGLSAQHTPIPNRVPWLAILPEPMPDGTCGASLALVSQFLRPDFEQSADKRVSARLDGEEWDLSLDLARQLGPGFISLRVRGDYRSGGFLDATIQTWHDLLGVTNGDRELVPNNRLAYHLEQDGVVVADLRQPGLHLMDTDVAYTVPFGDARNGWRAGVSLQLPTGNPRDFSGSGGTDWLVGASGWRSVGRWTFHAQAERVFLRLPQGSPFRRVMATTALSRVWVGAGFRGEGPGILGGLGMDLTLAYSGCPYQLGIYRIDAAGWEQHWTFTHRRLPRWRFGISEEAGTYTVPDFVAFVVYTVKR